jgi:hypothetical protein
MPDRCTPEYERTLAKMGALLPYRRARSLLEEFFPLGDAPEVETIRQRTLGVGARLEREVVARPKFSPPTEAQSIALAIDGGHVKAVCSYQERSFEVFVAQVSNDDGKLHDVHALDMLVPEAGAIYVMDHGYVDFARLYRLHAAGAFFVTRAKSNLNAHRVYSAVTDRTTGVIADQTIALDGHYTKRDYPVYLRRVRFRDPQTGKTLVFLTNMTAQPAFTICDLYKSRWQVELFFKWIKQHLRIKAFYGTSENAVKTQIWIAVSVYVLVAIIRKRLKLDASLYTLMQVFSVTVFEKASIESVILQTADSSEPVTEDNQLNLFIY